MKKDHTIFRYYKGEKENPFNNEKQNTQCFFWFYESVFENDFTERESSDWYAFFEQYAKGDEFMKLLSEEDHSRPTEEKKKQVFDLWLTYLFTYKLYPEYGGENQYKAAYYANQAH